MRLLRIEIERYTWIQIAEATEHDNQLNAYVKEERGTKND